jgi:hypothetical protein
MIAAGSGLTHVRDVNAFVSKVMVFDKPPRQALRQQSAHGRTDAATEVENCRTGRKAQS